MSLPPVLVESIASCVRHGGFVQGAELADNKAFATSPAEAALMDPQQRLLLERGYMALHTSCRSRSNLRGSLTGVFVGISSTEFGLLIAASPAAGSVYEHTGSSLPVASGRLSFALGLHGPCVSFDTACSAALVACHAGLRAAQLEKLLLPTFNFLVAWSVFAVLQSIYANVTTTACFPPQTPSLVARTKAAWVQNHFGMHFRSVET